MEKYIFFHMRFYEDLSNRSRGPTWQEVPRLTSHHSRVEAPEAQCQHFSLHSDTLSLPLARANKKALGIRDIRRNLIGPSIALLQSHSVVFSKPTKADNSSSVVLYSTSEELSQLMILVFL